MIASNANSKADSTGSFEQIAERRDSMAAKRWTIITDCGDVVARFESGEEAWGAFCSNAFLDCVTERYAEETDTYPSYFLICFDGVEMAIH